MNGLHAYRDTHAHKPATPDIVSGYGKKKLQRLLLIPIHLYHQNEYAETFPFS
jgi:hypothetical protein